MKIRHKLAFLVLAAEITLAVNPAFAHRFNVALVIALPNGASVQGHQIRDGFMLATSERDRHPDQESDGHLGGLDVYVSVIDGQEDIGADIARAVTLGQVDIVAAFGSEETLSQVCELLDGKGVALLLPGQTPFSQSGLPAVAAFISAYAREYGGRPTAQAAQGYNAARRIDFAVRIQGGAEDKTSLRRAFVEVFLWMRVTSSSRTR